jgi:hypothetical protein
MEAVVHVPYRDYSNPSAFEYLTVRFATSAFQDLALASENTTAQAEETYNSTTANAFWKSVYAGLDDTDNDAPQPLMMLPGGAENNRQRLTGINTTGEGAKIYLIMSENVTIAASAGVTAVPCGPYVVAGSVSGPAAHAPLTNPSCANPGDLDAAGQTKTFTTTSLSLFENSFGSSVVVVEPQSALK